MISRHSLFAGLLLGMLSVSASEPPPLAGTCPEGNAEVPLATETGSVAFLHNLTGHPDSIREVAGRLLEDALEGPGAAKGCEPDCPVPNKSEVVYRVTPTAFLATDQQRPECIGFEDQTREEPMEFEPRAFATLDELNDWIMEFSQGRGEDGKLLYERCSSNCSPRYTFLIAEQSSGYEVRAEVQCGLARDRSNNDYRISTALRRTCAVN